MDSFIDALLSQKTDKIPDEGLFAPSESPVGNCEPVD